jgi:hypothetical protein
MRYSIPDTIGNTRNVTSSEQRQQFDIDSNTKPFSPPQQEKQIVQSEEKLLYGLEGYLTSCRKKFLLSSH